MKRRFVEHEIEYSDLHETRGVFIRPVFIYVLVGKFVLKGRNENSTEINVITFIWRDIQGDLRKVLKAIFFKIVADIYLFFFFYQLHKIN